MIGLLFQLFAASADGQAYLPRSQAMLHTATKAAVSWSATQGLRVLGVSKTPAKILGVVGVFVVAKAIERAKGHTLGPLDTVNDLSAHALLVIRPGIVVGVVWVVTCKYSSPRWC